MNQDDINVLKRAFPAMVRSRAFEEKTIDLYKHGLILGSLHPGIGHEGASVGVCSAINDDDYLFTHHRGLGSFMYRGTDPKRIMAEWFGKKTGICGGKGGVTHAADISKYIMGINAIVGGNIPISVGLALAVKLKNLRKIVVCTFGDGAVNQGGFHEALNMASLWKLPILYVCENNMYAFSTSMEKSSAVPELEKRVASYGIPGIVTDGMSVLNVKNIASDAADSIRKGNGPIFINLKVYRYKGHSMSDRNEYRSREEEAEWLARDPVFTTADLMLQNGIMDKDEIKAVFDSAASEMVDAFGFAQESQSPSEEDLYINVYAPENIKKER